LTVTGPGAAGPVTATSTITVYEPVNAQFAATPTQGTYDLTVTFTDLSTGDYDTATWNFGDGGDAVEYKPPVKTLTHTYTKKGEFTVSLSVTGKGGSDQEVKTGLVSVAKPVSAAFTSDVRSGIAPLTVKFTNTSTGDYDSSSWDFDCDGSQDSGVYSPSFTYRDPGIYNVCLTVFGAGGANTVTKEQYIKVYSQAKADFSATPTSGLAPLTVQFTNLSTGDADTFRWDFESDGNVDSTARDPVHTYAEAGTYTVTMTASGAGGTDTKVRSQFIQAYTAILSVSPTEVGLGSWAGSGYPISVKNAGNGTLKWKASVLTGSDWLSISPTTEVTGQGELLLSYLENFLADSRTATISIEAADAQGSPVTVTVTQKGKGVVPTPELSVTPTQVSVDSATGTTSVEVSNSAGGTLEWTAYVREGSAWISVVSGANGTNAGAVELFYLKNTLNTTRTAVLRVRSLSPDVGFVDVVVTQASAPLKPLLTVSPASQTVGPESTNASFDVFNPVGGAMYWAAEVTSGADWLSISFGSQGASDGAIEVACTANPSNAPRTGVVRVTSSNATGSPVEVSVTQSGKTGCYGGSMDAASRVSFSGDAALMILAVGALLGTGARASRRFTRK
jgi:PKD repeat protein